MDIEMPKMDGMDATRSIRQMDHMTNTPIIAITAHALADQQEQCLRAGMSDFLTKPIRPRALADMIHKWCTSDDVSGTIQG